MLGPVAVSREGEPLPVAGGKTAELLVHLALAVGAPVRADRLLDDLWGGTPTNRNTLQQKVTRLRRCLGDASLIAGGDGTTSWRSTPPTSTPTACCVTSTSRRR